MANRSDLDLDREVAILILLKRGAEFGFPIVPFGNAPETLCGWLNQGPPNDCFDWGRDPRLVTSHIGPWRAVQHNPTGIGLLVFSLQGRWSSAGFSALAEGMRIMLPSRHRLHMLSHGCVRVCIFLCATPAAGMRSDNQGYLPSAGSWPGMETEYAWPAIERAHSILARMEAGNRQLPLPAPAVESALPPLSVRHLPLFQRAHDDLGDVEVPRTTDPADIVFREATWIELHRSAHCGFIRIQERLHPPADCADVVTLRAIQRHIERNEIPVNPF